ncbi:MAG: recombinase family protein, partial [Chloroflexota bacterium]
MGRWARVWPSRCPGRERGVYGRRAPLGRCGLSLPALPRHPGHPRRSRGEGDRAARYHGARGRGEAAAGGMTLPRALDELTGLRAARWLRESTPGQLDNFGPDAQREQQDRAIERYGLVDIGLTYDVAHSGRTIGATPQFGAMVAAAGTVFDILVVGYVSRFARDLRTAVNARHEIHQRGAALLFADERILSSDVEAWELWAREAVEAEAYSRRLAKRISEGYAAKFRRHADQAGSAPLGFQRTPERPHLLEVDPTTIRRVVDLFHRYATDTVSLTALAEEAGLSEPALRVILANPIYNGWVRRHRRGRDEERAPAPWRSA